MKLCPHCGAFAMCSVKTMGLFSYKPVFKDEFYPWILHGIKPAAPHGWAGFISPNLRRGREPSACYGTEWIVTIMRQSRVPLGYVVYIHRSTFSL